MIMVKINITELQIDIVISKKDYGKKNNKLVKS